LQKAKSLAIHIYTCFRDSKDFSFKDQICRAAISVSNNIAEGFERNTDNDFIRFLHISKGSNSEVKSMLYIAKELKIISEEKFNEGLDLCNQIGKILNGLINSIKKNTEINVR
jgi:four helix bundle protein